MEDVFAAMRPLEIRDPSRCVMRDGACRRDVFHGPYEDIHPAIHRRQERDLRSVRGNPRGFALRISEEDSARDQWLGHLLTFMTRNPR